MIFAVQGFERLDRELVGLRRQTVRDNVTINQLLPERIDSGRQLQMARIEAGRDGVAVEEARRRQAASIAARAARQARRVRCRLRVPVQCTDWKHFRRQPASGRRQLREADVRRRPMRPRLAIARGEE
jgi:hypothetical protein